MLSPSMDVGDPGEKAGKRGVEEVEGAVSEGDSKQPHRLTAPPSPAAPAAVSSGVPSRPVLLKILGGTGDFLHPGEFKKHFPSRFSEMMIPGSLSVLGKGRVARFEVRDPGATVVCGVYKMGALSVQVWLPHLFVRKRSLGKISGVSGAMTVHDITTAAMVLDGSSTVVSARRLYQGARGDSDDGPSYTPLTSVMLEFDGPLPLRVALHHTSYRVLPYDDVLRCWDCYGFGHGRYACRGRPRCAQCSGFHPSTGCTLPPHCFFCDGPHRVTSHDCCVYREAEGLVRRARQDDWSDGTLRARLRGLRPLLVRAGDRAAAVASSAPPLVASPNRYAVLESLSDDEDAPSYAQAVTSPGSLRRSRRPRSARPSQPWVPPPLSPRVRRRAPPEADAPPLPCPAADEELPCLSSPGLGVPPPSALSPPPVLLPPSGPPSLSSFLPAILSLVSRFFTSLGVGGSLWLAFHAILPDLRSLLTALP